MMPDCASPNSTPRAPVVTDASSTALVPTVIDWLPKFVLRTGAPSMYTFCSPGRPPRIETPLPDPDSTTPGCSEITLRTSSTGRLLIVCPDTMDFDATWSRGTIGLAAAVTVSPDT